MPPSTAAAVDREDASHLLLLRSPRVSFEADLDNLRLLPVLGVEVSAPKVSKSLMMW